ncbi:MAG: CpaF family protein [Actinomycetota bacterium]
MALRDRVADSRSDQANNAIADYLTRLLSELKRDELSGLSDVQRRVRLERRMGDILSLEGPVLSDAERATVIRQVVDEALGFGVLEPLLADESVTEIMVNGPGEVFVERGGKLERQAAVFTSDEHLRRTIDRIVSGVNRRVDESSPMVDARLPTGERVNVILPPLALNGPTMTIRRFPQLYSLSELIDLKTLDHRMATILTTLVQSRCSVVVSGGTGSGKTTLLNAMSGLIADGERIVTIEDAAELRLRQQHVVRLEARPANVEGRGQVTIRDLVRNSLRMRPDRIIVGEVRGGETLDMLQAMNTGHEGSLTTVHANSTSDALGRLEALATMSDLSLPVDTIRDQINTAVDVLVHIARLSDGSRRITELTALTSIRREEYRTEPIAWQSAHSSASGVAEELFDYATLPEGLQRKVIAAGGSRRISGFS